MPHHMFPGTGFFVTDNTPLRFVHPSQVEVSAAYQITSNPASNPAGQPSQPQPSQQVTTGHNHRAAFVF